MDNSKFFIGTSGWHYDHWVGPFYPPGLSKKKWLQFYASRFNTVEVNATFYRSFNEAVYAKWAAAVPDNFKFVLKAPKFMTHRKRLRDIRDDLHQFLGAACSLKDKFGLILIQLPPDMVCDLQLLEEALGDMEQSSKIAVEFRHRSWMTDKTRLLMEELGIVFCDVDSPDSRHCCWVTTETAYFRLHGRHQWYAHRYSRDELEEIASCVRAAIKSDARQVFIFFNNDFCCYAPENAAELKEILTGEADL